MTESKEATSPHIISVQPDHGKPGTIVDITGRNISRVVDVIFTVSSQSAHVRDIKMVSATTIAVTVPDLPPGKGGITLVDDEGNRSNQFPFTIDPK
jgi:IPT/TIG domain